MKREPHFIPYADVNPSDFKKYNKTQTDAIHECVDSKKHPLKVPEIPTLRLGWIPILPFAHRSQYYRPTKTLPIMVCFLHYEVDFKRQ